MDIPVDEVQLVGWQGAAQHSWTEQCDGAHGPGECPAGYIGPGPACSHAERDANMHIPDEVH